MRFRGMVRTDRHGRREEGERPTRRLGHDGPKYDVSRGMSRVSEKDVGDKGW